MANPDKLKCPNCGSTDIEWEYSEDCDGDMYGYCYGSVGGEDSGVDCEAAFAAYPKDYNIYRIDDDRDEELLDE